MENISSFIEAILLECGLSQLVLIRWLNFTYLLKTYLLIIRCIQFIYSLHNPKGPLQTFLVKRTAKSANKPSLRKVKGSGN